MPFQCSTVLTALQAHGAMMALAWGAWFPAAQLAGRFLKGKGRLSLFCHAGFNAVGLIFFIAGFALVRGQNAFARPPRPPSSLRL